MNSSFKKVISCVLIMSVILSASLNYYATKASAQTVTQENLNTLIEQYDGQYWTDTYFGATTCKGFAALIFNELFKTGYIGPYNQGTYHYYIPSPNGASEVARYDTAATAEQIKSLFLNARAGDFIQWSRNNASGSVSQHSAIFVSLTETGVVVFDCNWIAANKCGTHEISYEKFANNYGISLYTSTVYDDTDLSIAVGDVDMDGQINSIDALLVLNYSTECASLTSSQIKYADVDANGIITSYDALCILELSAKE